MPVGKEQMTDVFREVDEDLRREQLKKLWDRYGTYVLALAILIVVATAGWRFFEYWQESRAQATGDRFVAALKLAEQGKHDQAIAALTDLTKSGSGDYPVLAGFRVAAEKAAAGDDKGAVAEYDAVAQRSGVPPLVRDLARIRAALLLADTASVAELNTRIGDLTATGNGWRQSAREILGLAAFRENDLTAARKYFSDIAADRETPSDLHQRAELMLAVIDARQAPPAPAPAAPAAEPAKPQG
jgi:hypothetical protein